MLDWICTFFNITTAAQRAQRLEQLGYDAAMHDMVTGKFTPDTVLALVLSGNQGDMERGMMRAINTYIKTTRG